MYVYLLYKKLTADLTADMQKITILSCRSLTFVLQSLPRKKSYKGERCYALYMLLQECKGGVLVAIEPVGGYTAEHMTHGQSVVGPTVTFPAKSTLTAPWPVLISHPAEGRRLSWPVADYIPRRYTSERSPI